MAKGGGLFGKFWLSVLIVGLIILAGIITLIVLWATGYFKKYGALNLGSIPYVKNVSLDENNNVVVELRSIPVASDVAYIGIECVDAGGSGKFAGEYNGNIPSDVNPQPIVVRLLSTAGMSSISVNISVNGGMCSSTCYETYGPFYLKNSPNIDPTHGNIIPPK
jgi:hypothetical protein